MLKPIEAKTIPVEQQIFNESWAIIKTFYNITEFNNDMEWNNLMERLRKLYEVGNGAAHTQILSNQMALLLGDYFEILCKGKDANSTQKEGN